MAVPIPKISGWIRRATEGRTQGYWVEFTQEFEGRYSMEFQASDFVGNFSEILEYNIEVPKERGNEQLPNQYVTTLQFTGLSPLHRYGHRIPGLIFVEWDNEGAQGAALQQAASWRALAKSTCGFIETEDNVSFHWSETEGIQFSG